MTTLPLDELPPETGAIEVDSALWRLAGMRSLYGNVLRAFMSDARGVPSSLREKLANGVSQDAIRIIHTLKGTAATIGAVDLQNFAALIESQLKQSMEIDVDALVGEVESRLAKTITLIAAIETDFPPDAPPAA